MAKNKNAAFEEIGESQLSEITADQLLEATAGLDHRLLAVWPEKKKVELEVEPGVFGKIRLKDLIFKLQNEKKKYELEIEPGVLDGIRAIDFKSEKKKAELEVDPPVLGRIPEGIANEKKKKELEVDFGGAGAVSLDTLIDALEARFRGKD